MNREIKFRVYIPKTKTMHYMDNGKQPITEIDFVKKKVSILKESGETIDKNIVETYNFEDIRIMQYIGLKDINNVEIFEGDIVEMSKENSDFKEISVVKFDKNKASFVLETQDDYGYLSYDISYYNYHKVYYKVIGNIYENKELLEQE